MNVKFNVGNYWLSKATEIHYNIDEYSFSFEPYNNGAALLLINDLNLSANEENMLLRHLCFNGRSRIVFVPRTKTTHRANTRGV